MVLELLQELFQYRADSVDRNTWCCSRAACNSVKEYIMDGQCRNTKIYHCTIEMARKLNEAADFAEQIISPMQWSPEYPVCCSLHCCKHKKTGLWTPLHVAVAYASSDTIEIIQSLWWRDNPSVRKDYATCSPQEELTTMMEQWKYRRFGSQAKLFYVVCSENCLCDVKQALNTIHWRKKTTFEIFLGVDKLDLRPGDSWQIESSDEDHSLRNGDTQQYTESW